MANSNTKPAVVCIRCRVEFEESDYGSLCRAIMNAAPLCKDCNKEWLNVKKQHGLSSIQYVMAGDKIDW